MHNKQLSYNSIYNCKPPYYMLITKHKSIYFYASRYTTVNHLFTFVSLILGIRLLQG